MSAAFVGRFHFYSVNGNGHAVCAVVPVCVVVRVRKSRKEVSSRGGAKECCLCCRQADIIAMVCPLLTNYSGNAAAKFAKIGCFE